MLYFLFVTLLPLCCFADVEKRIVVRHIESGGIGYKDGYTTLEVFLAGNPECLTPFLDLRGHAFDNGKWAANAGLGLRTFTGNRIYGVNAYYDYRDVGRFSSNQVGVGLESLGERVDFRLNGYFPVGKKRCDSYDTLFNGFSGHYLLLSQKYQRAMKGGDAELGFHFGKFKCFNFYGGAGPYYFSGASSLWGGKARISGTYNQAVTLEISNSYDHVFHNKFQVQLSLSFPFGRKTNVRECGNRLLQAVERQEIIVVEKKKKNTAAINPDTDLPYFFVFVDNTSSSSGTYEDPYHSFAQAEANSSPYDIIYVFPGDGTTTGMNSGIALKANQKFWGSSLDYSLVTTEGLISIPAQSLLAPTITNSNVDTEGNAITLANNNDIRGFTITSALNDAIFGTDSQILNVSSCTFENTTTFPIEATFAADAAVSISDNQFLNNVNGIYLNLNGTSVVNCSNNIFKDQTSVSSAPIAVVASNNTLAINIENNVFDNNTTGSMQFNFDSVVDANIAILNNTITNNGTGFQSSLGSSVVFLSNGTISNCALLLSENSFSGNGSNSLYMHTSGEFSTLGVIASNNTMDGNGGSGLVLATPVVNALNLIAKDNIITNCNDNGIAVISSSLSALGNIVIDHNTITDIGNVSNGIAINQDFTTLNLSITNNEISRCEGTGILSYASTGIEVLTLNIADNTINQCQNLSSNAGSGIDFEQYTTLDAIITNNTLSDNSGVAVVIGSTLPSPTVNLNLEGNDSSTGYLLINPVDGVFYLSPCDADAANVGTINTSGVITPVCP